MTVIKIGVSYRTDGKGKSHLTYDCKAIESLNGSELLKKLLGPDVVIKAVPLPAHASNQTELIRSLAPENILKDLDDVDLLYIPGAPTALDSQIGSSLDVKAYKEEESFNKATAHFKKKDDKRIREEYESRSAYEHKLIDIARTRGMSILAVCAGSWRLLESYGGSTRTLPKAARKNHHTKDRDKTWKVKHDVNVVKGTILHGCLRSNPDANMMAVEADFTSVAGLNSTHWAVARVNSDNQLINITPPDPNDPSQLIPIEALEVNANAATDNEASSTLEGYESTNGAPVIGLQFHPENYLPSMLGEQDATEGVKVFSQRIFISVFQAALAYKQRRENNKKLDADQFCEEGLKYYHALGVAEDMQKAAHNFRLAAAIGHAGAQVKLGDIYEHGRIGVRDPKKAAELYKQAAAQGNAMAMFCVGHCYEHGSGLERDLEQAAVFYEKAFNKGYEGWRGYYKEFFERHPELREYLAANKMTTEQQRIEGFKYYHAQGVARDMHKAAIYLRLAAAKGDADAQVKLGDILEHGRIGARDPKQAAELYKQASAQNNVMAMFFLGRCYEYGNGLERNLEQAAIFYEKAFNKGYEGWKGYYKKFLESHPELQEYLWANKMTTAQQLSEGLKYYHGKGVVSNMNKAVLYLKLAAARGNASAQIKLGDIYEHGRVGVRDPKKAAELYKQAAAQGNAMAMFCVGHCYEYGSGLERDLEQAAIFYEMAFNKGYEGWKGYYKKFLESHPELQEYLAANKMTTEQQRIEGLKYYHAQGVARDMHKAALYLKLAAARGDAKAQVKLGDIYEHGRIGVRDPKKAVELYRLAVAQNDVMAMFFLGRCYEQGSGLERDLGSAAELYERAYGKGYEGWRGYFSKFIEGDLKAYLWAADHMEEGTRSSISTHTQEGMPVSSKDKPTTTIALVPQFNTHQQKTKGVHTMLTISLPRERVKYHSSR